MKLEIIEQKENKLLERKEIRIKVAFNGATPKREELRKKIIELLKSDAEKTIVDSLRTQFGKKEAIVEARIYSSKEKAIEIEPEHIIEKNFKKQEEKNEEQVEEKTEESKE